MSEDNVFQFWSISESDLDVLLYNILTPLDLGFDENLSWEEFRKKYPHFAYAWNVREKFIALQRSIEEIQTFQKMLSMDNFPIITSMGGITRHEWLRIIIDLMLYRVSSIRDCFYILVVSILEFSLGPSEIRLKKLKELCKNDYSELIVILDKIAIAGKHLRDERNKLAHEGIAREMTDVSTIIFKVASLMEKKDGKAIKVEGENGFDIQIEYNKEIKIISEQLISVMAELSGILGNALEELACYFKSKFESKET